MNLRKSFDKCLFYKPFQKLLDRKIPPIVISTIIYVYEEQEGCVKLLENKSDIFGITNVTRQGSVLSPALFLVYL